MRRAALCGLARPRRALSERRRRRSRAYKSDRKPCRGPGCAPAPAARASTAFTGARARRSEVQSNQKEK